MPDATIASPKTYQCRHLFTDGHRCGSKSLRGEQFCFYHHITRKPIPRAPQAAPAKAVFDLPFPEDRAAIQLGIGEILQRIARNEIDPRRAGLLLYGLQIASLNLPKPAAASRSSRYAEEEEDVLDIPEEIVADPTHGLLAPIAEYVPYEQPLGLAGQLLRELAGDNHSDHSPTGVLPDLQASILRRKRLSPSPLTNSSAARRGGSVGRRRLSGCGTGRYRGITRTIAGSAHFAHQPLPAPQVAARPIDVAPKREMKSS